MKKITLCICLFVSLVMTSQEKKSFEKEIFKISKKIDFITKAQKDSLKVKVIAIESKLQKGEITKNKAAILKSEVAMYHAKQIEIKVGVQEMLIQQLVQDKTNGKIASSIKEASGDKRFSFFIGSNGISITDADTDTSEIIDSSQKKRTTTQLVFAMGVNNVIQDHKQTTLSDSEYKFWQSHFYELGFSWKTRFAKETSQIYFKYGMSFLWNNLRLDENQYHVMFDNTVSPATFPFKLTESRLRHVQMNFPVHLEWNLSRNKKDKEGLVLDGIDNPFRLGIGGFVGFKLGARQYLEYKDAAGM
ncbi:MAG: hypothetical protein ACI6PN_07380, partial [Polaribacter sp.]|uniref:hypothetical protein n=1 Tax=Polaribacter sp. TaxID=1920175 RepID=UPI00384CBD04